jgi:uncharacterized protein YidB (DUF937 family)
MDFMNRILGQVGGGSRQSTLMRALMGLLANRQMGGLAGLVSGFQRRGMGDIVDPWVSWGQNKPISPQQVLAGLGREYIQRIASETGMNEEEASSGLAEVGRYGGQAYARGPTSS